jgi:flagellar biogenesis protein FliO
MVMASALPAALQPRGARAARSSRPEGERRATVRRKSTPEKASAAPLQEFIVRTQTALSALRQTLALALRPLTMRRTPRRLRVMETLSLSNKQTLSLVRVDGQDLLIGGNANTMSLLAMLDCPSDRAVALSDVKQLVASFHSNLQ